jgi:hypothetical protein
LQLHTLVSRYDGGAATLRGRAGRKWIRAVAVAAFVVSAIAALTRIPYLLRAAEPERISASTRALAPATFYGLNTRLLESAARDIPRNATYAVIAGGGVRSRFVRIAESTLLDYWLLPRRRTDLRSSDWIVSIGGDLQSLGIRYSRLVRAGRGMALAMRVR